MASYFGHVTGLTAPAEEIRRTGYMFNTDNPTRSSGSAAGCG